MNVQVCSWWVINSSLQKRPSLRLTHQAVALLTKVAIVARCMHWAIQPIPIHCCPSYTSYTSTDSPEQGVGICYLNSGCRRDVLIGQFVGSVGCKVRQPQPLSANHIQTDRCVCLAWASLNSPVLNLTRIPWKIPCIWTTSWLDKFLAYEQQLGWINLAN